ncbi:mediator of RNA polymerase II transcription subunit 23, partial [Sinocyclocheilus grahami]|uniref:mediator of RNA polymerase II transcription subunit 23 n=1 Tax=Sinocyclocheilus grahami TaxID=75366 RepID=UPI0007AD0D06
MAVPMESQLQSIFEDVVKTEVIEEAFTGMFMDSPEDERTKLVSCLGAFRQYWSTLPQESHDQCVQWIVRFIHSQHSPKRISFLYDCLAMAVETSLLPPRMVCQALMSSDSLEWERTQLWALTFKLIRKIIGGVDYKVKNKQCMSSNLLKTTDLFEPQTGLLRYVLEQPYSRDMVCNMLGLNKQTLNIAQVCSQSFCCLQLAGRGLIKGRDHLMWVLLQFISGSIQKNALADFLPVMKLFDLLYPEKECIPVPDINKPQSTHAFAMTCIWIHLNRKAQNDNSKLQIPIPHSLKLHHEFLQQSLRNKSLPMTDYKIALLCNAYSTNSECFTLPMGVLVETIYGNGSMRITLPGTNCMASGSVTPLPMNLLDSLTVHAKMSLIHSIATRVIKLAHAKSSLALAPALVETYSRLLVYMEIESLGIKGFISQLLPNVFKSHAWGILHTLLEMFSYRMHHIQPHYRVQLLSHLHSLAAVPQTNQNQLHLCVESTALRLITALGSSEVQPQFTRFLNDPKTVLSAESEELNRALILTLARATHVTDFFTGSDSIQGTWCKDILQTIMNFTPHNWASHTLSCFPAPLQAFFKQNNVPQESRFNLKKNVEEEYRKWKSMTVENDIITHFSMQGSPPLFLCLLWKMLLETDHINQIGFRVLERIGARALVAHVRTFADFLVYEFSTSAGGQQLNKCIEILNDMVWKYNIVTLDRLILCLAMRSHEGNEAQVCYFIIQLLLLKPNDFKYPEKLYFEGLAEQVNPPIQLHLQYLPIYFGNVCLRFLPVFDIVIHRFLELLPVSKSLETLLDHLGGLYKFHDRPVTYLYNTLHYYERHLRDRTNLKRKLVHAIMSSLKDNRTPGWCLSETYLKCAMNPRDDNVWIPDDTYYCKLIGRLVDTMAGKSPGPFPNCDWRFNEFPNPAAHALHVTCVELMALAVPGKDVGNALLNVVLKSQPLVPRENITAWMNAIGLVITALPISSVVKARFFQLRLLAKVKPYLPHKEIESVIHAFITSRLDYLVSSSWCCSDFNHGFHVICVCVCVRFLSEVLKPIVKTEFQLLYVYHLVGPFLQRFQQERTRCMLEIGVAFYEMLQAVDQHCKHLAYMDPICDFLYHIKYMFTGDSVKDQVTHTDTHTHAHSLTHSLTQ